MQTQPVVAVPYCPICASCPPCHAAGIHFAACKAPGDPAMETMIYWDVKVLFTSHRFAKSVSINYR